MKLQTIFTRWVVTVILPILPLSAQANGTNDNATHLIVVVGAGGEKEYGENFATWAMRLKDAAGKGAARLTLIGLNDSKEKDDREALRKTLETDPKKSAAEMWLVLIGHGTFDGKFARFNMRGPDITAQELDEWLNPFQRPVAVINCASASGAFFKQLSRPGRITITATKSGIEHNYARFGDFFTARLGTLEADLDKDGQVSLLEAFIVASKQVEEFYQGANRLATEHALLDDNGDGLGTRSDWFRGVRATKKAQGGETVDGFRAHQFHLIRSEFERKLPPEIRAERNRVELEVNHLREAKSKFEEDVYYAEMEKLMLKLARLYEKVSADKPISAGQ